MQRAGETAASGAVAIVSGGNVTPEQFAEFIRSRGGNPGRADRWGKRRFAYEINKKTEGIYAVIDLTAEPATVKELDRQLSLNESVVRTKVTRPDVK